MKILFSTLFISFLTVFATPAFAGSDGSEDQVVSQGTVRLATCKDCLDAGYRRGFAEGEAAALENTPKGSSSVTTPLSYRKPVYVNAQVVKQQARQIKQQPIVQARKPAPKKPVQHIKHSASHARHAGHGHHTKAQILDCELTDSLNRSFSPVTTIISTKTYKHHVKSPNLHFIKGSKPKTYHKPKIQHHGHTHHTEAEKADCALTDALNRKAGPVTTILSTTRTPAHTPVRHVKKKTFNHGNHSHLSEVEKADCALTDALNRQASVVRVVRKY